MTHVKVLSRLEYLLPEIFPGVAVAVEDVIREQQLAAAVHLRNIPV